MRLQASKCYLPKNGAGQEQIERGISLDVTLLLVFVVLILAVGLGGTLWVGFSKANREGDPNYEHRTGSKLTRLTLLYLVTVVVAVSVFFAFRYR
jgi:heme/copper-type cytochrome/quinol oxidase subunit 2